MMGTTSHGVYSVFCSFFNSLFFFLTFSSKDSDSLVHVHSHVEAMSNLAATLLSLNRREEAEQHWLQSVKLRPSYFEAVEHLIGLLCGAQRGTEAVGIIEFVERSLRVEGHLDHVSLSRGISVTGCA